MFLRLLCRLALAAGLAAPLCGRAQSAASADNPAPPLLTIAEVRSLSPDELAERRQVRVRGVITYAAPEERLLFVQDGTDGMYVRPPRTSLPRAGTRVELVGRTHPGAFAPRLDGGSTGAADPGVEILVLGEAELPPARVLEARDIASAVSAFRRIEISGVVRAIERTPNRITLNVTTILGAVGIVLRTADAGNDFPPADWVGAVVRARGVAGPTFNERREQTGLNILVPRTTDIEVVQGGIASFVALPRRLVSSVTHFDPQPGPRVRLRGVVTLHEAGRGFYLRDESGSIWVKTPQTGMLDPGEVVDAVGFPATQDGRGFLDDAFYVERSHAPLPAPVAISAETAMSGTHHGEFVEVQGFVTDRFFSPNANSIALQAGTTLFIARIAGEHDAKDVWLPPRGAWVSVTGVCVNTFLTDLAAPAALRHRPVSFQILLRSHGDMRVLEAPSWWTIENIAWVLAGVSGALILTLGTVVGLVRRTRRQAGIIRETRAREAVHEERQRIARELHDTLEQELTGLALQLDTASDTLPQAPHLAGNALEGARTLLRHTRAEARRSIWDLRAVALEQGDLPRALREAASHLAGATCIDISVTGEPRRLAGTAENNLLRIAVEAMTNAVKHACASRIDVQLAFAPDAVRLAVRDDGRGFDPATASTASEGHFGLLGMRERAARMNASVDITSAPGAGTQITVNMATPMPPPARTTAANVPAGVSRPSHG